jgi:hypothetical protein
VSVVVAVAVQVTVTRFETGPPVAVAWMASAPWLLPARARMKVAWPVASVTAWPVFPASGP